jgi:hypothetical protein
MPFRVAAPVALSLLLLGCPQSETDGGDPPPEAEYCSAPEGTPTATRDLEVGAPNGDDLVAWQDGDEVEMVSGGQGGTMIVPSLRVPVGAGDGDEACWVVMLDNELADTSSGTVEDFRSTLVFQRRGDFMQVDGVYDLLGYGGSGLAGNTLTLKATVIAEAFRAERTVAVILR